MATSHLTQILNSKEELLLDIVTDKKPLVELGEGIFTGRVELMIGTTHLVLYIPLRLLVEELNPPLVQQFQVNPEE